MTRDLLILGAGRAMQILLLFATYRVMTRLLSEAEVGFFFLLMSVVSYFGLVVLNPVGVYLNRKIHAWYEAGNAMNAMALFAAFLAGVALLALPIVALASRFIDFQGVDLAWIMGLIGLLVFSNTLNNTVIPSLNLLNFRVSFVVLTLLTQATSLGFSALLTTWYGYSAVMWLVGVGVANLIIALLALALFSKRTKASVEPGRMRTLVDGARLKGVAVFAVPLVFTNLALWILNQSYRPMVEHFVGLDYLALVGLGFGVAASLAVSFEYLIHQLYFPAFYRGANDGAFENRQRSFNDLANKVLPLYLALALFLSFLAPFVMTVMADPKFQGAAYFLVFGVWIEFFRMSSNIVSLAAHSEMKTKLTVLPYFIGGLVLITGILLSSTQGTVAQAVPIVVLLGNISVFVALMVSMRRLFKFEFETRQIKPVLLLALVFPLALFFHQWSADLLISLLVLMGFGVYFLASLYWVWRKSEAAA